MQLSKLHKYSSNKEPNAPQQNFELFFRIMYVILLSHIGYLGIFFEIVWNYNPYFFIYLRWFTTYSNYICVSAILNNRLEKIIAVVSIYLSLLIAQVIQALMIG